MVLFLCDTAGAGGERARQPDTQLDDLQRHPFTQRQQFGSLLWGHGVLRQHPCGRPDCRGEVLAFSSLAMILWEGSTIHCPPALFLSGDQLAHTCSNFQARISPWWLSELRRLWPSVTRRVARELVFPSGRFPHYAWTAYSRSTPTSRRGEEAPPYSPLLYCHARIRVLPFQCTKALMPCF